MKESESVQRSGGPWGSLLRVFWEPGAAFAYLAERRPMLAPYLVQSLLMAMVTYQVFAATAPLQLPPDALAAQPGGQATPFDPAVFRTVGQVSAAVGGLLAPWFSGLLSALIMLLAGALSGGAHSFRAYYSVAGYAMLPGTLGSVAEALLQSQAANLAAMQQVTLSAAALAPGADGLARAFLLTLHPAGLWVIFLAMTGFAAVHGFRLRKALGLGVALWLLSFAGGLLAVGLSGLGG